MKKKMLVLGILSLMVLSFIPVRMITMSDDSFVVSARADGGPTWGPPICYECEYDAGGWYCIEVPANPYGGSNCEANGSSCHTSGECSW